MQNRSERLFVILKELAKFSLSDSLLSLSSEMKNHPRVYYNDNDKQCAAWIKELIIQGAIPYGDVDDRSIRDIEGTDLAGYDQCHFFAGIGGWAYALELAGWCGPVWTGSCPCQPFSAAGKQQGTADERHIWPEFHRLIAECGPATVFGEQVASKLGREWLAGIFADLESVGYAVAGADLCAAGVGAPHIRQRLYWLAKSEEQQLDGCGDTRPGRREPANGRDVRRVGDASGAGLEERDGQRGDDGAQREASERTGGDVVRLADAVQSGRSERWAVAGDGSSPWRSFDILQCTDGKARRIEPGSFPLAHGIRARVGRLRGYGNAIVPQVAAEFVKASGLLR